MEISVNLTIPDELLKGQGEPVSRRILEQVVAESYKTGRLTLAQVRRLLDIPSRIEAENFLQRHRAIEYSIDDLESDLKDMRDLGLR